MNGDNTEQITTLVTALLKDAHRSNHRRCIVIAGEQNWTAQITDICLAQCLDKSIRWVSTKPPKNATTIDPKKIQNILGDETDIIVFDAFSGFNPDVFGAVAGIIRGGGLLLLLTPELSNWDKFNDPEYERISVHPTPTEDMTGRFLQRLSNIIKNHQQTILIEQGKPFPTFTSSLQTNKNKEPDVGIYKTDDQECAVEAIKKVVTGHRRRPLVLTADRGRGKTAALGIAAAQLMQQGVDRIIVTAPRADALNILFKHAASLLKDSEIAKQFIQTDTSTLEYFPPDELVRNDHKAKLLIVDEAAAIPAPILEQLLKKYSRIVFASTIHGYEGTGRGFAIRFHHTLQMLTPNWKRLTMQQPIRWAENDPLEDLTFRSLLLDSNLTDDSEQIIPAKTSTIEFSDLKLELIDREKLTTDESSLQQLFGLLVNAHYQTKPSDLRYLLDGPNLSIFVLRRKQQIIATALIATEGGFDAAMANDIYLGKRRPHGHLIPEVLAAHLGLKNAPLLLGARIVRIAVQPSFQNQGIGRFLLESIQKHASLKDYDYLASSFGATIDLLHFWKKSNYVPIRIGFQRNACSGEHSIVMFNPISSAGKEMLSAARQQFSRQFAEQLSDPLQDLEANLVAFLLQQEQSETTSNKTADFDEIDRENIIAFVNHQRIYEAAPASIKKLTLIILKDEELSEQMTDKQKELLIHKVLQKHSWERVSRVDNYSGKKSILKSFKETLHPFISKRF